MSDLILNQTNSVLFVMVDSGGTEVAGLTGAGLTVQVSKAGGAFAGSAGTKAEVGSGWYSYELTAGECDTVGPVAIKVTGAGCVQQNLEYVVKQRTIDAIEFTYVVDDGVNPLEGATVWITTDVAGTSVIWEGTSDSSGVALDNNDDKPFLTAGTYYFWVKLTGYSFAYPDTEIVS